MAVGSQRTVRFTSLLSGRSRGGHSRDDRGRCASLAVDAGGAREFVQSGRLSKAVQTCSRASAASTSLSLTRIKDHLDVSIDALIEPSEGIWRVPERQALRHDLTRLGTTGDDQIPQPGVVA